MSGFGASPTTSTQGALPNNQVPISSVAVPGKANGDLTALKGGPEITDANGNKLSGVALYTYDGENETFGAKADSTATTDSGTFTFMALVKRLLAKFPTIGAQTTANSLAVNIASDQAPLVSATATRSNVTAAASDTSLLASNANRKGAIFYNDSTAILYLAYGSGAASTTSYSVQIPAQGYFELPPAPVFTGAIRGIWAAANGAVRITEIS